MTDSTENKSNVSKIFEQQRKTFSEEIYSNITALSDIRKIKEVQVNLLSLRQRMLEDSHQLIDKMTVLKRQFRKLKGEEWEKTSKDFQMHYRSNEKAVIVDGKTSKIKEALESFEHQISFLNESIKTVDNAIFGLKTRLDIERLLGGGM